MSLNTVSADSFSLLFPRITRHWGCAARDYMRKIQLHDVKWPIAICFGSRFSI